MPARQLSRSDAPLRIYDRPGAQQREGVVAATRGRDMPKLSATAPRKLLAKGEYSVPIALEDPDSGPQFCCGSHEKKGKPWPNFWEIPPSIRLCSSSDIDVSISAPIDITALWSADQAVIELQVEGQLPERDWTVDLTLRLSGKMTYDFQPGGHAADCLFKFSPSVIYGTAQPHTMRNEREE